MNIRNILLNLTKNELIKCYSVLLEVLKERQIIRTNNLVGDLGETLAINYFKSRRDLPNLKQADPNEKAYDAYDGDVKYAIKSTSTRMTGVFWGLEPQGKQQRKKIFHFVLIVLFDRQYNMIGIYQLDWKTFLKLRSWHSTTKSWKVGINREFKGNTVKIFPI